MDPAETLRCNWRHLRSLRAACLYGCFTKLRSEQFGLAAHFTPSSQVLRIWPFEFIRSPRHVLCSNPSATLAVLRSTVRSRLAPPHQPPEIPVYRAIPPDSGLSGLCPYFGNFMLLRRTALGNENCPPRSLSAFWLFRRPASPSEQVSKIRFLKP